MSKLNRLQSEIKSLEGGKFQKLCDSYLYKKNGWDNIHSLGSMDGTDKTTKGIPDSYYHDKKSNQYILVMYGTRKDATAKLKVDIEEAITKSKLEKNDIKQIVCCHTSSNITVAQDKELKTLAEPIELELIGIDTLSQELLQIKYQDLAFDHLGISKGTDQVWSLEKFIEIHDSSKTNASLMNQYIDDKELVLSALNLLSNTQALLLVGKSGTGKTRLAVEICKKLPNDAHIICVKSNSEPVYQDIKDSLNPDRVNYLFLDDANVVTNMNAILSLLMLPDMEKNLKIIMTVRDYALPYLKEKLIDIEFQRFDVTNSHDKDLRKVISGITGAIPNFIEDRIIKLANGNNRIAVLAAMMFNEQGADGINDSRSILESYYEKILNDNNLSSNQSKTLFILSFIQKTKLENEGILMDMLCLVSLSFEEFKQSLYELHHKELCDIYNDKVSKITDQSLKDYVLYKNIMKDKKISLEKLFKKLYPKYSKTIITSLNSANIIDSSDQRNEFLKQELKKIWNHIIQSENQIDFLIQYSPLLLLETTEFIVDFIEKEKNISEFKFTQEEFDKNKNQQSVSDKIIILLCSLSDTEKYSDAGQLLINYFKKRPDKIMQVYSAIINYFGLDSESQKYYDKMQTILSVLQAIENKNLLVTILFVNVAEEFLKLNGSTFNRNGELKFYLLKDGEPLRRLHRFILQALSDIYVHSSNDAKILIEKLLFDFPVYEALNGFQQLIESDLKIIESSFFNINNVTLVQENIISNFKFITEKLKIDYVPFNTFTISNRQELYNVLTSRYLSDEWDNYNDYQIERTNEITSYFTSIDKNGLKVIFEYIVSFKKNDIMDDYKIDDGLLLLFRSLDKDMQNMYLCIILNCDYESMIYLPQSYFDKLSFEDVEEIINSATHTISLEWKLANLLRCEVIDNSKVNEIENLIEQSDSNLFKKYSILSFEVYIKYSEKILDTIIQTYKLGKINPNFFIPRNIGEGDAKKYIDLIGVDIIKSLYIENLKYQLDWSGYLFKTINESNDDQFIVDFLKKLSDLRLKSEVRVDNYEHHLKGIWDYPNSEIVINLYLDYLIEQQKVIYVGLDSVLEKIMKGNLTRAKDFIENRLRKEANTENKHLLNIANIIFDSDTRIYFFRILKEIETPFEQFKEIQFLPLESSWSGSRVPLLDIDIEFINKLLVIFNGLDYIKYEIYLNQLKNEIIQLKENELVSDYLNDE
ncbi:hypothetical protein LI951_14425 [Enterococcus sp. BWT-B8]|uniref:nSTAND3 domain-containing NTPase n=1 Tax=Enterococcus sp. BWT-B8 TaxID=2885157 RepID=UPI001E65236C|nr:hypothetical protein [Enterococcus sp. BWT-B8]MCB5953268.1 hypothetical protein [Enterococcus sp. BWT-B8]